jgi:hypothetical protein
MSDVRHLNEGLRLRTDIPHNFLIDINYPHKSGLNYFYFFFAGSYYFHKILKDTWLLGLQKQVNYMKVNKLSEEEIDIYFKFQKSLFNSYYDSHYKYLLPNDPPSENVTKVEIMNEIDKIAKKLTEHKDSVIKFIDLYHPEVYTKLNKQKIEFDLKSNYDDVNNLSAIII